jgi:His-Xaa-Ser system radical SAM maturase HxsC
MTPLALTGSAIAVTGTPQSKRRMLLRLRAPYLNTESALDDRDGALVTSTEDLAAAKARGFSAAVLLGGIPLGDEGFEVTVRLGPQFGYLSDGDIMSLDPGSRRLRVIYRRASKHNAFLVTERCNHYCLMCSQPPKDTDDRWILDEIGECIELLDPHTKTIGFTGGEPLLEWQRFVDVLSAMRDRLPETGVHVLTNGRAFALPEVVSAWAGVGHKKLMAGIPIYSAVDAVHDYIVQAQGAFDETVLGILRLKDQEQRVEVRLVLHAVSAPRLRETCRWFARNLPFVDHVALMGLENTGFALANEPVLWIDPLDYRDDLTAAVDLLRAAGVPVSIYNLPLCLLDHSVWDVAVQSISDWKNDYLPQCARCAARPRCAGFFSTGRPRISRGIRAIAASGVDAAFGRRNLPGGVYQCDSDVSKGTLKR